MTTHIFDDRSRRGSVGSHPGASSRTSAAPTLAPALERHLRRVVLVKAIRRQFTLGAVAFAATIGVGVGLPAYASVVEQQPTQQQVVIATQSLTVSAPAIPAVTIIRDDYSVFVPPPLQYPLITGTGITSGYGMRGGRMHQGADIFPGAGTPIHAMAAGVVTEADKSGDYGNHVMVKHVIDGQSVTSVYAHMADGTMTVSVGQTVAVGEVLGAVGETGNAQGPHLHFEIHPGGGGSVDPYPWLAARV